MPFCDECGLPCPPGSTVAVSPGVPACPTHGPRWRLARNAPCAAVLVTRGSSILLSRRAREPWAGQWEVPGGFVEKGEHPAEGAVREVREELGIDVRLTGLLGIYIHPSLGDEFLQITVYLAETDTSHEPVADPHEVSEWRWFAADEVPAVMASDHRQRIDDWIAGRYVPLPGGHRRSDA